MEPDRRVALEAIEILRKRKRNALLSIFIPGLGQIVEGRILTGISFLSILSFPFYYWYLLGFPVNYGSASLLCAQALLYALQILDAQRGKTRETSPCEDFCPIKAKIPSFMASCESGNFEDGFGLFFLSSPFPLTLGEICPAPCEEKCGILPGKPLRIREVHREMARIVLEKLEIEEREPFLPETGKRVAIVGGGLAGITAAYYLASCGVMVDLFEKEKELGGLINYIPRFKLNMELIKKEIEYATSFKNLNVFTEREIKGKLFDYDAVIISIGSQVEKKLETDGEGIIYPLNFLKDPPELKGKKLAVLGAGDTAIDVAILGAKLGADVSVFYRGNIENIRAKEVSTALKEGVKIYTNCLLKKTEEKTIHLSCGSFKFDYLVPAIGFETDRKLINKLSAGKNTFVTGDASSGMTTFVEACGRARETAAEVLRRLKLSERIWFTVDIYREKPKKGSGSNLFVLSESSLCQHCGVRVRS